MAKTEEHRCRERWSLPQFGTEPALGSPSGSSRTTHPEAPGDWIRKGRETLDGALLPMADGGQLTPCVIDAEKERRQYGRRRLDG
jgi:hypothetical protein